MQSEFWTTIDTEVFEEIKSSISKSIPVEKFRNKTSEEINDHKIVK